MKIIFFVVLFLFAQIGVSLGWFFSSPSGPDPNTCYAGNECPAEMSEQMINGQSGKEEKQFFNCCLMDKWNECFGTKYTSTQCKDDGSKGGGSKHSGGKASKSNDDRGDDDDD